MKKKSLIIISISFLILGIGFFFLGNSYENYQVKEIKTYQELSYNTSKDMFQVKDNDTYLLLDQNLNKIDESKSSFTSIYDNYYVKNTNENYQLIRKNRVLENFNGYPFKSNQVAFYYDGTDSLFLTLDGKPIFNDDYKGIFEYKDYYATYANDLYHIYNAKIGYVFLEVPNIQILVSKDINTYFGILVKDGEKNRLYPLYDNLKSYIEVPYDIVSYNEATNVNGFPVLELDHISYLIVKDKNNKYGVVTSNGEIFLDVKYDYLEYTNNYFIARENDKYYLFDETNKVIYHEYDAILINEDYHILEKNEKITIKKDNKILLEMDGDIENYSYANHDDKLVINILNGVIVLDENKNDRYSNYQFVADYINNKVFLYQINDKTLSLCDISKEEIVKVNLKNEFDIDDYVIIEKINYHKDYYLLEVNYNENVENVIISLNEEKIIDKNLIDLIPIDRVYYQLVDNKLNIYDRDLNIIYSKDNIIEIIKVKDNKYFLRTIDDNYILIEINRIDV